MAATAGRKSFLYCGTESPAVIALALDPEEGTVEPLQIVAATPNAAGLKHGSPGGVAVEWVAANTGGSMLFACVCFWDHAPGMLHTFSIDPADGTLCSRGAVPSGSYQPCHAVVRRCGDREWLVVAHYLTGSVAVFDVSNGAPTEPTTVIQLPDHRPIEKRTPAGSEFEAPAFGVVAPLAHGLAFSPTGSWIVVADAGQGSVVVLSFDAASGSFHGSPQEFPFDPEAEGALRPPPVTGGYAQRFLCRKLGHRPRHIAFAGESVLLIAHEIANEVTVHNWDEGSGAVGPALQRCSSYEPRLGRTIGCCGLASCLGPIAAASEIAVGSTGTAYISTRALYGTASSLRLIRPGAPSSECGSTDEAVWTASGDLHVLQEEITGKNPRHFLVHEGLGLIVLGERGSVAAYSVKSKGGAVVLRARTPVSRTGSGDIDCVALVTLPACRRSYI